MPYVLALDQGTTSTRAIVFDGDGVKISQSQRPLPQVFPQPGWVEHDPLRILEDQVATAREAIHNAGIESADISGIGVTNQRETVVVWDRLTGEPLGNAIVWQDRRTAPVCDALIAAGKNPMVRERTGLGIDPYFSATKIAWILDEYEGAREAVEEGRLLAGTIDTWLIWNLTGRLVHATDVTNASRTQLFDIEKGTWDSELCQLFDVPEILLPDIVASSQDVGDVDEEFFGHEIPIAGICGDQQSALVGNGGLSAGAAKATFGTGIFALMHTGTERPDSDRLAVTRAAQIGDAVEYALEGSIFMGGAVVQWLVESLGIAETPLALTELAETVPDSGGVVFVPALTGLGAPQWDPYARGAVFGLTRGATSAHIARAGIEAIPLQVGDLIDVMGHDSGRTLTSIRVDGGVTVNDLAMQTLADVLGISVHRASVAESTALGVAYLAGLATGVWESPEELPVLTCVSRVFAPESENEGYIAELKVRWSEAVLRSLRWERAE